LNSTAFRKGGGGGLIDHLPNKDRRKRGETEYIKSMGKKKGRATLEKAGRPPKSRKKEEEKTKQLYRQIP